MTKKKSVQKKQQPTLGQAVMVYTKSSSHWYGLIEPKFSTIEGMKFLEGIQVTGKTGHRMERKRTLIPFDHVASIVEFQTEDDLFSEPQTKHIRPNEEQKVLLLTSHEQEAAHKHRPDGKRHDHRNHKFNKHRHGNNPRFQDRYDSRGGDSRIGNDDFNS